MSTKRLVEIAIRGKDESKGAFNSLDQSLKGGKISAAALAAGIAAVGFAVYKASERLNRFVTEMAELGDAAQKLSDRLGISVEGISRLNYIAESAGINVNTMAMALQRMTRRVSEAARDTGEAQAAIKELGLEATHLATLAPDQMFYEMQRALSGVPRQADRVRLAFKLFDSEGVTVVQTLKRSVEETEEAFSSLGGAMSSQFAGKSEEFTQAQTNLATATQRLKEAMAEPFLAQFTDAVNRLANALGSAGRIAKDADIDREAYPIAMELNPNAKGDEWLQAMEEARAIVRRRREVAGLGYDPEFGDRYQGPRPDAYVGSPERLHLPSGDFRGNWHDQSDSMALAWEQANPMEASLEGLQGMLLEVDTASQSLTEGFQMMTEEQANLTIEMERWMNTTPFVRDSILNISSSVDQAFFTVLTSTESFGRAFVAAMRRTFADTLASIGGSLVRSALTSIFAPAVGVGAGFIGPPSPKMAGPGNKSLPGQAAMFGMGHAQHDAAAAYGKAYL